MWICGCGGIEVGVCFVYIVAAKLLGVGCPFLMPGNLSIFYQYIDSSLSHSLSQSKIWKVLGLWLFMSLTITTNYYWTDKFRLNVVALIVDRLYFCCFSRLYRISFLASSENVFKWLLLSRIIFELPALGYTGILRKGTNFKAIKCHSGLEFHWYFHPTRLRVHLSVMISHALRQLLSLQLGTTMISFMLIPHCGV